MIYPQENNRKLEEALAVLTSEAIKNGCEITHIVFKENLKVMHSSKPFNTYMSQIGPVELLTSKELRIKTYRRILDNLNDVMSKMEI